jgi:hypothetical protein
VKRYHVEPFDPAIGEREATKQGSTLIAQRMAEMINKAASQGWDFEGYSTIQTTVKPGCLTMFAGPRTVLYGMLVFSRDDSSIAPSK